MSSVSSCEISCAEGMRAEVGKYVSNSLRGLCGEESCEAYAITSHTPLMCIAILAGLQVPGWSDARLEFRDTTRTAGPLMGKSRGKSRFDGHPRGEESETQRFQVRVVQSTDVAPC